MLGQDRASRLHFLSAIGLLQKMAAIRPIRRPVNNYRQATTMNVLLSQISYSYFLNNKVVLKSVNRKCHGP
jgi:hypothetical protein